VIYDLDLNKKLSDQLQHWPELIAKLHKLEDRQYVDADTDLGQGNYVLKPELARFRVTVADWQTMMTTQQHKLKDSCLHLPSSTNAMTLTVKQGRPMVQFPTGHHRHCQWRKRLQACFVFCYLWLWPQQLSGNMACPLRCSLFSNYLLQSRYYYY